MANNANEFITKDKRESQTNFLMKSQLKREHIMI